MNNAHCYSDRPNPPAKTPTMSRKQRQDLWWAVPHPTKLTDFVLYLYNCDILIEQRNLDSKFFRHDILTNFQS